MVQFQQYGLRFHELMRDGGYKSQIRIYSIDLSQNPIDVSNQSEVEQYGTLLKYKASDTSSNGRIAQNGIQIDNYYNKDEQYTIGNANMCSIRFSLINDDGFFASYDWEQTIIVYWDVWDPTNSIWITLPLGVYWWERPIKTNAVVVNARANDGMYQLGQMDYVWPDFSGGKKLGDIYESIISNIAGLIVYSDWYLWPNMDTITYNSDPFDVTNMTRREVLAKLAEIAGANAFISRSGVVMLMPFTDASWIRVPGAPPIYYTIDGDSGPTPITKINIGEYTVPLIDKFIAQVGQTGQVYTIGTGGNEMYSFNNGFLGVSSEDAQTMLQNMYWSVSGQYGRSDMVAYTPIALKAYADPSVEAGDVIRVIRNGTTYLMPVFQQTLKWNGADWTVEMQNSGTEKRTIPSEAGRMSYVLEQRMSGLEPYKGGYDTSDNTPYVMRPSFAGNREDDKLIGGTIAWNQLCNGSSTSVPNGHKYVAYIGGSWSVGASNGTALSTDASTDKVFDITQMFGSTIADYIYTLESGTAGAGVAWLKSYGFFADDNYSYHAATLESVNVSAHVMRDSSDNIIGNYPLDSALTLRGILKLDANNELYYDGDEYASDGTVTRRYGIVDLGTLNWQKRSGKNHLFNTSVSLSTAAYGGSTTSVCHAICSKYAADNIQNTYSNEVDKTVSFTATGYCYIEDSAYSDAAAFKAAMSGVYLVYELATPTTETADPYTNPQVVDADGTEQYVDAAYEAGTRDFEMPVGHNTDYYNLQSDAQEIYNTPTTDGSYRLVCNVVNGKASFVWVEI